MIATRRVMTPSASSRCSRFQQGVDDKPTRWPISATESDASCWTTARIFLSIASILRLASGWESHPEPGKPFGRILLFSYRHLLLYRKIFYLENNSPPPVS